MFYFCNPLFMTVSINLKTTTEYTLCACSCFIVSQIILKIIIQIFPTPSFTLTLNRRNQMSGHLFQGRYKAFLVEDETYKAMVSRYIHLNAVMIVSRTPDDLENEKKTLESFKWSSYKYYIGKIRCPKWLEMDPVLENFGHRPEERMMNYKTYIAEGLTKEIENPFERLEGQLV